MKARLFRPAGHHLHLVPGKKETSVIPLTDKFKDQTGFLSQMPQSALQRTMFPLADMLKPQVSSHLVFGSAVNISDAGS